MAAHTAPAGIPPGDLPGLDPRWSRTVFVPATDGVGRTWHLLDTHAADSRDAEVTLLCVHGNPSWSYLFRDLLRQAPPGVRVIAVDQLEMGFSERSGRFRRLATRVEDLCELTDELGLTGPVVTVAHDWGGPVSLGWAQRHRGQLAGVVLMNTAVHQPEGSPAPTVIRIARSRPVLQPMTVQTSGFIAGALLMSRPAVAKQVRRGYLAPYRDTARRTAIGRFVADIPLEPDHPSASALDGIAAGLADLADVPALLLWGAADKVFSDLYLHDLEQRLPHAAVQRYPRAAHLVTEDVDAAGDILAWLGHAVTGPATDRLQVPDPADTTAASGLDLPPDVDADAAAIVEPDGSSCTFGELRSAVDDAARGLVAAGVRPGQRVAVMIPPGIDLAAVLFGCLRAGAVAVLIDAGLGPQGMHAAARVAAPDFVVGVPAALGAARALRWSGRRVSVHPLTAGRRRLLGVHADLSAGRDPAIPLPPRPGRDDPAAVVFTSGATGPSKGVTYSHRQLEAQRDALRQLYSITGEDRLVAAFAPFAIYGPALGITSMVPEMDVSAPGSLTATALAEAVRAIDATLVFASPGALRNVVRTSEELTPALQQSLAGVRLLLSAGAPVRADLLRRAVGLFPHATAHTPYGMTECLPVADISLPEIEQVAAEQHSGAAGVCVGHPVPGVEVRIDRLTESGGRSGTLTRESDQVGEVVVRAAHARTGYDRLWRTEFAASQPRGWHRTGDVGQFDAEGRLWIGGRLGHVISTSRGPVAPVAAELAVERIPAVAAAAVVGVGPRGNQQIVVAVETLRHPRAPRSAPASLIDLVRAATGLDVVAVFEVPRLPVDRRHNSKVDRSRIAAWAEEALAGGKPGRL